MELAKLTSSGQVTIPIQIRKKLNLKEGDKLIFLEEGDNVVLMNASLLALGNFQTAMEGVAEQVGIETEEDVMKLSKEIRREQHQKNYTQDRRELFQDETMDTIANRIKLRNNNQA